MGDPAGSFKPQTLDQLLEASPDQIARCDIALMNLLCAGGLPGAENLDIAKCIGRLEFMVEYIRAETERNLPRFRADPGWVFSSSDSCSEAHYRMAQIGI